MSLNTACWKFLQNESITDLLPLAELAWRSTADLDLEICAQGPQNHKGLSYSWLKQTNKQSKTKHPLTFTFKIFPQPIQQTHLVSLLSNFISQWDWITKIHWFLKIITVSKGYQQMNRIWEDSVDEFMISHLSDWFYNKHDMYITSNI